MKKLIEKLKNSRWMYFVIILVAGLIVGLPVKSINVAYTHDGFIHLVRLIGTFDALKFGIIPPIISPTLYNEMGYGINLFYSAITCYLPLIIKLFTPTFALALKIFGIICIILSGFTMYKFSEEVTKNRLIALFSAILYMIAPYKLANVYVRYALGEFMAAIFTPLVFLGMYDLFNKDGKKHYYIAIGAIGLIFSHTISTFYVAIFCLIYVLFFIKKLKEKEIFKKLLINILFIILISAMIVFPIIEALNSAEYAIMNNDCMATNNEFVYENTIQFLQLIKYIDNDRGLTFVIGIPMLLLTILSIFVVFVINKKYKKTYIIFMIFSILSIIMCTKLFPWKYVPEIFCKLQFPWRMLGFFIFFASFLGGVNLEFIIKKLLKKEILQKILVFILIMIMIICGIQSVNQFIQRDKKNAKEVYEKLFNKEANYTNDAIIDEIYEYLILYSMDNKKTGNMNIGGDYLPYKAVLLRKTYLKEREDRIYILSGNATIYDEQKDKTMLTAKMENIEEGTILELPYIYYPGYKITIENSAGEIVNLKTEESENGFLSTNLVGIEEGTINVKYVGTLVTKLSYVISGISIILFIIYIFIEKRKEESA